jgi:hypothetical protein
MVDPFSAVACAALRLACQIKDKLDQLDENDRRVAALKEVAASLETPLQMLADTPVGTPLQKSTIAAVNIAKSHLTAALQLVEEHGKKGWVSHFLWCGPVSKQLRLVTTNVQSALQSVGVHAQVAMNHQMKEVKEHLLESQRQLEAQQAQQAEVLAQQQLLLSRIEQQHQMLQQLCDKTAPAEKAAALAIVGDVMEENGLGFLQMQADIDSAVGRQGYSPGERQVGCSLAALVHCLPACMRLPLQPVVAYGCLPLTLLGLPPMPQVLRSMKQLCRDMEQQLRRLWRDPAGYTVHRRIGGGGSGQVYSGYDSSGRQLAMKLVDVALPSADLDTLLTAPGKEMAVLRREVAAMALADGAENVCRCGGAAFRAGRGI